jgi:hypothetical protein
MAEKGNKKQKEFDGLFALMEAAIRLNTYEAADLLFMVADLIPANPVLAAAIGKHAADFIGEAPQDVTWTDIVCEAYRRALFDTEKAQLYGTGYFLDQIGAARTFVNNYIAQQTLGDGGPMTIDEATHTTQ